MDTYTLQRMILNMDLPPAEKLVGMALAFHLDRKTVSIRVRQEKIAEETGYSVRSVKRATKGLIAAGVFASKRTRGAAILVPISPTPQVGGKNSGMDVPRVAPLTCHRRHIKSKKGMPWNYDLTHSTLPEEKAKREEHQFALERAGTSGWRLSPTG